MAPSTMLWDVIEEHFAEVEFLLEQFDVALRSVVRKMRDCERHPERRLMAHADGVVLGGEEAYESYLFPVLESAADEEPSRVAAAIYVLLAVDMHDRMSSTFTHESPPVRRAARRAAELAGTSAFDKWLQTKLAHPSASSSIGLLELAAARKIAPPNLMGSLQSTDEGLLLAAVVAAQQGERHLYLPVMEDMLEHPAGKVRNAAIVGALRWGSGRAAGVLERLALHDAHPSGDLLMLFCALGGGVEHRKLAIRLGEKAIASDVVRAMGLSGNPELVPLLINHVEGTDVLLAKLAAQSLALIVGFDPLDERFAVADASPPSDDENALPALEDDDLDAELVPPPDDDLPTPNAAAIAQFCAERAAKLADGRRWVWGQYYSLEGIVGALEVLPLGLRHSLALALDVRTGGRVKVDSRSPFWVQRAQMAAARATREPISDGL